MEFEYQQPKRGGSGGRRPACQGTRLLAARDAAFPMLAAKDEARTPSMCKAKDFCRRLMLVGRRSTLLSPAPPMLLLVAPCVPLKRLLTMQRMCRDLFRGTFPDQLTEQSPFVRWRTRVHSKRDPAEPTSPDLIGSILRIMLPHGRGFSSHARIHAPSQDVSSRHRLAIMR